jgi:hypothetical protein
MASVRFQSRQQRQTFASTEDHTYDLREVRQPVNMKRFQTPALSVFDNIGRLYCQYCQMECQTYQR